MFPLLCDKRRGPPRCFSKPPRLKYASIATSKLFLDYLLVINATKTFTC